MRTSEQLDKIANALFAFQKEITPPAKNKDNPYFKSRYADLPSLLEHCKPVMQKHGLVFVSVGLCSRIMHTSGQWIEGDFKVDTAGLTAQQLGSAETYARRYSLQGLLSICAEEDDDANSAAPKPAPAKMTTKPGGPVGGPKPMAPKTQPQDEDRVPASVTDGQEPAPEAGNELELATVKAYSKPKTDKKNNEYRGVLLVHADNTEKWWNLYHAETIGKLQNFKGKQVYARLEMKGEYPLCHELTAVSA